MISHTVRSGESLSMIAKAYLGDPMRYSELARFNGIANPNVIRVGQVIRIPESGDLDEDQVTATKIPELTIWNEGDGAIPVFALEEIQVSGKRDLSWLLFAALGAILLTGKRRR